MRSELETNRSLVRSFDTIRKGLESLLSPERWQFYLLQELNELTGSSFSAINLCDSIGRPIGGLALPISDAVLGLMHKYTPTLGSLIEMEVRSGFFADVTYGKVKV